MDEDCTQSVRQLECVRYQKLFESVSVWWPNFTKMETVQDARAASEKDPWPTLREDKEWKHQKKDVAGGLVSSERTHRLGSQRCIPVIVLSTTGVLLGAKLATETPLTWTVMCLKFTHHRKALDSERDVSKFKHHRSPRFEKTCVSKVLHDRLHRYVRVGIWDSYLVSAWISTPNRALMLLVPNMSARHLRT